MKRFMIIAMAFGLSACAPDTPINQRQASESQFQNIKGLTDCMLYDIQDSNVLIVRCPNSTTTTSYDESCGKNCRRQITNVVTDGAPSSEPQVCDTTKIYTQSEADAMCLDKVSKSMGFKPTE